ATARRRRAYIATPAGSLPGSPVPDPFFKHGCRPSSSGTSSIGSASLLPEPHDPSASPLRTNLGRTPRRSSAGAHRTPTVPNSNPRLPLLDLNPGTSPRSVPPVPAGSRRPCRQDPCRCLLHCHGSAPVLFLQEREQQQLVSRASTEERASRPSCAPCRPPSPPAGPWPMCAVP
uniref:Uncharacterized protein n=1 Tax=Triticum urartu TaxID=4572 RepID=A0A8R7U5C3_TRIUA